MHSKIKLIIIILVLTLLYSCDNKKIVECSELNLPYKYVGEYVELELESDNKNFAFNVINFTDPYFKSLENMFNVEIFNTYEKLTNKKFEGIYLKNSTKYCIDSHACACRYGWYYPLSSSAANSHEQTHVFFMKLGITFPDEDKNGRSEFEEIFVRKIGDLVSRYNDPTSTADDFNHVLDCGKISWKNTCKNVTYKKNGKIELYYQCIVRKIDCDYGENNISKKYWLWYNFTRDVIKERHIETKKELIEFLEKNFNGVKEKIKEHDEVYLSYK